MAHQALMNTYSRLAVAFERGDGVWLFDTDGNKYFDTFSGIAVCGLGHASPAVTEAIKDQCARLVHCSNLFHTPVQLKLAQTLCDISGMDRVFFANSGAEANEAAIKMARLYGHKKGINKPAIIVMEQAFHGRTMATLTATGNRKAQAGFEPLLSGFVRAPFNDIDAIRNIAKSNPNIVAVMLEPIQGEGGLAVATEEYMQQLRAICDQNSWLMIADEVQTGNGRTGTYFACEGYGVKPDIISTAKGLGNGFPIGACLATGEAADLFHPGHHGSTFGGNPLACAAAQATVDEICDKGLMERAEILGKQIMDSLNSEFQNASYVKDIRGKGLMIGIEMAEPCQELTAIAKSKGLLLNITSEKVIRLLPALNMTDKETGFMIEAVIQLIKLYAADDRRNPRS